MAKTVEQAIEETLLEVKQKLMIPVEVSGRHVHLSKKDLETLFGYGYELTPLKPLSQPGQYLCKERLTLTGKKGTIDNVAILGPVRKETQVEISMTDALKLGVEAVVRMSGDIKNTPGIDLSNANHTISIKEGVIVAKRHLHITSRSAWQFGVEDKEIVKIKVFGKRPVILEDLVVRVSDDFSDNIHIDYDEANACGFTKQTKGLIIK